MQIIGGVSYRLAYSADDIHVLLAYDETGGSGFSYSFSDYTEDFPDPHPGTGLTSLDPFNYNIRCGIEPTPAAFRPKTVFLGV
jgi:hypothetical protein